MNRISRIPLRGKGWRWLTTEREFEFFIRNDLRAFRNTGKTSMKTIITCLSILLLVSGITGCGSSASVTESGDRANVFQYGQPEQGQFALELKPVATYTDEGPDSRITFDKYLIDIVVDDQDSVYLKDMKKIMMFDASGRYLRQISRIGQGPGEHSQAFELLGDPGSRIAIYDHPPHQIMYFDEHVRFDHAVRLPYRPFFHAPLTDSRGRIYGVKYDNASKIQQLLRYDPGDHSLQTVATFPAPARNNTLTHYLVMVVLPAECLVYSDPDSYTLFLTDSSGKRLWTISLDESLPPMTERERNIYGHSPYNLPNAEIPDYHMPVSRLLSDGGDLIFAVRYRPRLFVKGAQDPLLADVFHRSGRYLARVVIPVGTMKIRHGYLYEYHEKDEQMMMVKNKILNYDRLTAAPADR